MAIPELFNNNEEYRLMLLKAFDIKRQIEKLQKEYADLMYKITNMESIFYNTSL